VILVAPRNPLNIGAAARAMSNFGFRHLRLVNPYEVAFQEARSAVHAHKILRQAQEFSTLAEAIADCSLVVGTTSLGHRELQHTLRPLEYAGRVIRKRLAADQVGLLFGSEKFGLSNDDLSYCHWLLRIGTEGSMNLGQAVAVCLYELIRNPAPVKPDPRKSASAEDVDRLTQLLTGVLDESGYLHNQGADAKIRRLVRRLSLAGHDAEIWLGMVRQIQWRLRQLPEKSSRKPHG
jgi:tRNA/rRNA methyltransferase